MTGSSAVTPNSRGASTTPLHVANDNDASSVQVAVRVRPMLSQEAGSTQCIEVLCNESNHRCVVRIGGDSGPTFTFDEAFPGMCSQRNVFETRVVPLVRSCLEGYNATVLAYGQTGSGKTHTIMGPATSTALQDEAAAGVIPRALRSLFDELEQKRQESPLDKENLPEEEDDRKPYDYEVRVQFLELYGEVIRDLLSPQPASERLTIRDVGLAEPEVLGATQHKVETAEEALLCLTRGMLRRVTGATAMNASSSRSHAILSVLVEQTTVLESGDDTSSSSQQQQPQHVEVKSSKFNFVDLAGSERQKRTQASGQRLKEGIDINKGLLVLGNVISALGDPKKNGKTFVPYRDSKLTRLLKGSLGGNHKTLMIACVSPASSNLEESLNCLRYANRAKNIQNKAVVNVDAGSRLVVELRSHVQALARELLKVREGEITSAETFSTEMLKSLAGGADSAGLVADGTKNSGTPRNVSSGSSDAGAVFRVAEDELQRTKERLRQAETRLITTSEKLYTTKAEKEMYRIQAGKGDLPTDGDSDYGQAFLEKACAYEREIAELKESLKIAQSSVGSAANGMANSRVEIEGAGSDVIEKASRVLDEEKAHLSNLQKALSRSVESSPTKTPGDYDYSTTPHSPELNYLKAKVLGSISLSDQLDAEEAAARAELSAMTQKYTQEGLSDEEIEDGSVANDDNATPLEDELAQNDDSSIRRRRQLEAHLLELSKSIDSKQELIEQLQLSQQKYATMREFYEEKLRQMEEQVKEREVEREQLVQELKNLEESKEESDPQKQDLQQRLAKKEEHIAGLRQKKNELLSLTRVSSQNESQIIRLKSDVVSMKQKKVELQKQITQERKHHANEIKKLKKEAMQKEREASKYKKISDKKAIEAENAQRVAKSRLEEVGQLRTKYKEAEKKLRMQTLKRGVMEKAGLDPVMVGRREPKKKTATKSSLNVDSMRDFLDAKVADVGRKEAIADKVALEWEEHLELVSQKEDLLARLGGGISQEDLDALDVQIQYKEGRIRQLAHRLGKQPSRAPDKKDGDRESFLDERGFKSLCTGTTELSAARVASRVLFGMVVRERRRVAALARTASSLDEKVVEAEERASAIDAAFRSYMDEEITQRASMTQNQQEQILSLMAMVQQEDEGDKLVDGAANSEGLYSQSISSGRIDSRALVLANERISVLEQQLNALQGEKESKEVYKAKEAEANSALAQKTKECEEQEQELNRLRSTLRQIREAVSRNDSKYPSERQEPGDFGVETRNGQGKSLDEVVLDIVSDALHPSRRQSPVHRGKNRYCQSKVAGSETQSQVLTQRLKRHIELMHSSDSEDEGDIPDWAGDIMEDLSLIASGEMPPSLRGQVKEIATELQKEKSNSIKSKRGNVFDRLADPESFTGVQKQVVTGKQHQRIAKNSEKDTKLSSLQAAERGGQHQRMAISRAVSDSLDKIVVPDMMSPSRSQELFDVSEPTSNFTDRYTTVVDPCDMESGGASENEEVEVRTMFSAEKSEETSDKPADNSESDGRSVFDRLMSPSSYTGVQKVAAQGRKARSEDTDTDKLLDELLDDSFFGPTRQSSKVEDYTQQNVFERLQRTTTQSYAVKKNAPATRQSSGGRNDAEKHSVRTTADAVMSPSKESSSYIQQDVFERLQKTTTQAYAGKKYSTLGRSYGDHDPSILGGEIHRPASGKNSRSSSTGRESPLQL